MKRRSLVVLLALTMSLLSVAPAFAWYNTLTGELRDSKTGALWIHGASVEVFNCNTLATIATTIVDSSGVFSIDLTGEADRPLCIEVVFNDGGNGTPGNAAKGPYPDRQSNEGTLNTGVYFTGAGPTAVVLRDLSADSANPAWTIVLAGVAATAAMLASGLILRKRVRRA